MQYDNQEKWFKEDKQNLGFDFPNIPYLIDGDFKITESSAVARYIIKRSGKNELLGKNAEDMGRIENVIGVLNDAIKPIRGLFFNKDYANVKIETLEKARDKLNYIREFVGDKPFVMGYLTLVDFYLADYLYLFETLYPSERKHFEFWWRIRKNFEALPEIQAYYKRKDAVVLPFFPPNFAALQPKLHHVKLGYWGIRGAGQIPRLLLHYSGVEFENYTYTDGDLWFKDEKHNLGLNFPNLPYLVDDDYNISEAAAVQRYICSKWKPELLGKNIQDNAKMEAFLAVWNEVNLAVKMLFFNKDWKEAKGPLLEKFAAKLDQCAKFVGEKPWVLGYFSLADFVVAEDFAAINTIFKEELAKWPFVARIKKAFDEVPEIKSYYELPTATKGPYFPKYALFHPDE